jgi:uncharacterized protein YkwD
MRRTVAALLVSAGIAVMPISSASAKGCAGADQAPQRLGPAAANAAVLCLLNSQRAAHRLRPLRFDARLARAARAHSSDMVAHRYFAHDSRSGASFAARISRTGWTRHRRSWIVGENIAWGDGTAATPAAIVSAWMHSAGHRANILNRRFRAIGIGIASGTPGGHGGATYSTDFGS